MTVNSLGQPAVRDDGTVYWLRGRGTPGLDRYRPGRGEIESVTELSLDFAPSSQPWLSPIGTTMGWVGLAGSGPNDPGDRGLLLIDLESGKESHLPLPGVTLGWTERDRDLDQIPVFDAFYPALIWNTRRSELFIVHADEDMVTVVDLSGPGVSASASFLPTTSFWQRLLAFWVPAAHAKLENGNTREGVINPDGARLYVAGRNAEAGKNSDGHWYQAMTPLGLLAIDTASLQQIAISELPIDRVAISPDGRLLLATGSTSFLIKTQTDYKEELAGIYFLDPGSLEVLGHLETDEWTSEMSFSPDGRFAYLTSYPDQLAALRVVDLNTFQVVAERRAEQLTFVASLGLLAERP